MRRRRSTLEGLFLDASDLMADMGLTGKKDAPVPWKAAGKVIAACHRHDKTPGMGGLPDDQQLDRARAMGMRYLSGGHGAALLHSTAAARVNVLHS